jgi:gliding motility-associated-like protein
MRKIQKPSFSGKVLLLSAFSFLLLASGLNAQTITTPYSGGLTNFAAPANIAFVVENTNAGAMILTGVSQYCETTENGSVWELYYSATSLSGAGSPCPGPLWNLIATSSPVPVAAIGIVPVFTSLNFTIPAGTQYRFVMRNIGPGNTRYVLTPNPTTSIFSTAGVNLKVGNQTINGENVGYSGNGTTLATSIRYWHGAVTFAPAGPCTDPPVVGTVTTPTNPVCAGSNFTLSINGGSFGSGQTYQWQSSPNNTSWTNAGTGAALTTSQTASSYYRVIVTCGTGKDTSDALLVGNNICYCTSVPTSAANDEIFSVTVNGATNTWDCNLVAPGPGSILNRYSNFYPLGALTNLIPGSTIDFTVEENECDGAAFNSNGCAIWIDFNHDGDFDEANERVFAEGATTIGPRTINGNITIPSGALAGITGMRIIIAQSSSGATLQPCMTMTGGEVEDYLVNIIPPMGCSGTPNPGTASAFPTTVCLGQNLTLTNTGAGLAVSQAYQWQVSTNNGASWSDLPGATNFSYTTTQSLTSLYRFRIICENTNDTAYTNETQVFTPPIMGGVYTIDKSVTNPALLYPNQPVFNNFNDAYNAMKCGINNAVTLNVAANSGPYDEQLIMSGLIPGASATNTITFNGNGNTLTYNTNATQPAVIKLRNINYIRFDSLVIVPTGTANGFGVHLTSDANYNIIRNCTINVNNTATGTGFAGVVISGSETSATGTGTTTAICDFNEITNNTINGGYYGVTVVATFSGGAHGGNKIVGNRINDYYAYGIYISGTFNTLIELNTLSRPARTNAVATLNGIYFTSQSNTCIITRNRITNPFGAALASTTAFNAISFSTASASAGNDNQVTNNLIYKMNGMGVITGIANAGSNNTWYLHNSVSLDSLVTTGTPTTRGFAMTTAATGLLFLDNLISVTRAGPGTKHAIHLTGGLLFNANNNNYYINAPGGTSALGFYSANRNTLADWKTATGHDANSYEVNPVFVDVNNGFNGYIPGNAAIDNQGIFLGVDKDILGIARNTAGPDIGAYEFTAPGCAIPPVNGATSITPSGTVCQQSYVQLNLNIGPFGSGQTFQWQTSPNPTGPFTNLGVPMLTPDTLILATTTLYYRAIVSCGSAIDSSNAVQLVVSPAMPGGTYTINKGSTNTYVPGIAGGNFISFNDAKTAMSNCGILGPIVFNVVGGSGPYNEQLKLDSIRGASAINTITFNGNGNTIAFDAALPPTSTERAVIKLSRADHIIFDSLTIDATGAYSFGYGVQLISNADSNTFRRCNILASLTATTQNYNGIIINSADAGFTTLGNTLCDSNTFDRNIITGGYYGATIVGNTGQLIFDNTFTNNTIQEFYSAGLYVAGTYNTLIEGNIITRPTRSTVTTTYGIYATAAQSPRLNISKNRITKLFGGAPASTFPQYGIYHNAVDVTAGNDNIVSNNLIYNLDGDGIIYALYNTASDGVRYYHNTISLDNTASVSTGVTRGFYQVTAAVGIEFMNNIISIRRGGTAAKHAIYLETPASEVASDYNDLYVSAPGTNNHVGFANGQNRTSLSDWTLGSPGDDSHSYSVDPVYIDMNNGVTGYAFGIQTINNQGTWVSIPTDILGVIRNPGGPDIGAYETTPPLCINPPIAGTASVTPASGVCLEAPIQLNLAGHSALGTLTIQWQSAPTATGPWTTISPVLFAPEYNTVTTSNTFYRAMVICGTGTPVYSTVTSVTLNSVVLQGSYTIDNSLATNWPGPPGSNFNSFSDAVNAMLCGITGPVVFNVKTGTTAGVYNEQIRIPYIPNSSSINTVTFQSNNGNPASATLTYALGTAGANYTLKLDSTKYITFRNMTIAGTNTTYGRVVEFANTASFNTIDSCVINAPVATTTINTIAGVYAAALKGNNNTIIDNTINNGSMGIYFWGTGVATGLTTDHLIENNTINGAYSNGIIVSFQKRARVLRNTINVSGTLAAQSYGIYASDCDSSYTIAGNNVNINNTTTTVYGVYVTNSDTAINLPGRITSNTVTAATGNTGSLYGLYVTNSPGHQVLNNVLSINTTSTVSYGLFTTNIIMGRYYNNSVNITSPNGTATNAAAHFNSDNTTDMIIRNNIFSNKGSGRAMYISDARRPFGSDYNMLYSAGSVLVQTGVPVATYLTLETWKNSTYWDRYSIVYPPAFVSNTDLHPDLANPDVWAMHGRGVQIPGNNRDFNNNTRPVTLTTGVPDLGAFEFYPTSLPTLLTGIPAGPPTPGVTQAFMYGTDTVTKIKWGNNVPPTAGVRRYSGVVPTGLTGPDSMYFYTQVETPGSYDYSMNLFYLDPWQGSIPQQWMIGLGRTTPSNVWVVGFSSTVQPAAKRINQSDLTYMNKFTGLVNPYAPPVLPDKDSSNRGRRFWVAYAANQLNTGSNQQMVLYLSAEEPANVTVKINGTSWVRNYLVPANSVTPTEFLPKAGPDNAFLRNAGLYDQGISIESDVPIVVYAHATGSASSGAAMLLPVSTWGYEYKTLGITQNYGSNSFSYFYAIADNDNTKIEVTPTIPVQNGGMTPGTPYTVILNKGQVFQVLATSQSLELSGSTVRSVPNSADTCYPIAVFSGSSRTSLNIGCGSGGDFMMQQNFPATAWGKHYLTAPSSASTDATLLQENVYRIAVRDPLTKVWKNGTLMTGLVNGHYYQFNSATADYIESDKPIMVAQFLTGSCTGVGDPELIYISPIEQGINKVGFYRNNREAIVSNLLTMVIPTNGLGSLVITDGTTVETPDHVYDHPANGTPSLRGVNYSVVVKRWTSAQQQVRVQSDSSFTAITYGLGSVESYGYNAGTLVKNISATGTISNTLNVLGTNNDFTCAGSKFKFRVSLALKPTSLTFKFSSVPNITPSVDVTLINPIPVDSTTSNWTKYYIFEVPNTYTFSAPGLYPVQVIYEHPDIEGCDHKGRDVLYVQVVPPPKTNFTISSPLCEGGTAQFSGETLTANGIAVNQWDWTFHDATTATGQLSSFTYPLPGTYDVKLHTVTPDGCEGDSIKHVVVNPKPVVGVVADSIAVCTGSDGVFSILNPLPGATYNWYGSATGGTLLGTGTSFTATNVTAITEFFVEGTSAAGCTSLLRKRVVVGLSAAGAAPVVTTSSVSANSITFSWNAIPGASGYEVSVNNGPFITPSSGATGLTHVVTGLGLLQSASIVVRSHNVCGQSESVAVNACTNSMAVVTDPSLSVCDGANAIFTIQTPTAGITYTWYNSLTGGTGLATGTSYTVAGVSTTASYYVEQSSNTSGCVGSPRTPVLVSVLPPLNQVTVTADSIGVNAIKFRWNAVPGAASYVVSINGGTFITPSSGPSGLTHVVTGLLPVQQVTIVVKAIGAIVCQESISQVTTERTLPDDIYIPNTFTPNNDGVNDYLRVYGYIIQEMNFEVFNQWGEKIFQSRNQSIGWDGTHSGKAQPSGVYMYVGQFILRDGTIITRKGSINLIR